MNNGVVLLGNVYRPSNADSTVLDNLEVMLEKECKDITLTGDLKLNVLATSKKAERMLQIAEDNNLEQLITEPTSYRITIHSHTLIELHFATDSYIYACTGTAACTSGDHLTIFGE